MLGHGSNTAEPFDDLQGCHGRNPYDMRKELSTVPTNCALEPRYDSRHPFLVLTKIELLTALQKNCVKNTEMMAALDLESSRVSEIMRAVNGSSRKPRELSYDEGVRLIRAFGLEQTPEAPPALPPSTLRLVVRHLALKLGASATEDQIAELAKDLRAFSEYVASPKVRQSIEAA